jgi:hypothetical protein
MAAATEERQPHALVADLSAQDGAAVLADRLGRMVCEQADNAAMALRGELAAGLYEMSLATRDGGFDVATTLISGIWHFYALALLESVLGQRLPGPYPFLNEFRRNAVAFQHRRAKNTGLGAILLYLARRERDGQAQADADRALRLAAGDAEPNGAHPFAVVFHDPSLAATAPSPFPQAACAENGTVICRATAFPALGVPPQSLWSLLHHSRGAGGTAPSLAKRRPAFRGFGRVGCHPDRLKAGVLQEALWSLRLRQADMSCL